MDKLMREQIFFKIASGSTLRNFLFGLICIAWSTTACLAQADAKDRHYQTLSKISKRAIYSQDSCLTVMRGLIDPIVLTGDSALISSAYFWLGMSYPTPEGVDSAMAAVYTAYRWAPDPGHRMMTTFSIASFFSEKNMLDSALVFHHESLALALDLGNDWGIFSSFVGIGEVFLKKSQYSEALPYFRKALLAAEGFDPWATGIAFMGIAESKMEIDLDSAAYFANEAVNVLANPGQSNTIGNLYFDALEIAHRGAMKSGNIKKALVLLGKMQEEASPGSSKELRFLLSQFAYELKLNNLPDAYKALRAAAEVDSSNFGNSKGEKLLNAYVDYYAAAGDFEKAYYHQVKYQIYKDSVLSAEGQGKINFYAVAFKLTQLSNAQRLLGLQNEKLTLRLEAETRGRLLLVAIVVLVALMLFSAIMAIKQRNNSLREISALLVENQEQKELLQRALDEKELLLREIHHRVRNNFQIIAGLMDLNSIRFKHLPEVGDAFVNARVKLQTMSEIHALLYDSNNLKEVDICAFIHRIAPMVADTYRKDSLTIDIKIDCMDIFLPIHRAIPLGLIIHEGLANAIQHAFGKRDKGQIKLSLTRKSGVHKLTISDNGIGLNHYEPLMPRLIQVLVKQLNGSLEIQSDDGAHLIVTFGFDGK